MKIEENKIYDMITPSGKTLRVRLSGIKKYPASGMPDDYLFKCFTPCKLLEVSPLQGGFPLPDSVLDQIQFVEVLGKEADDLLKEPFEVNFK